MFQESDAPVFFGRDALIKDIMAWLNRLNRLGGARLGLMLGASGCGKSSLLRAGVLPLLRQQPADWLVIEPFRPLCDPWGELIGAVRKSCDRLQLASTELVSELRLAAEQSKRACGAFLRLLSTLRKDAKQPGALCLVIIDQLEEVLESKPDEPAGCFAAFLRAALESADTPLMVLGTIRSDLLAHFQLHPLGQAAFDQMAIGPLTLQGFMQAIEESARVAEITLESGLSSQMVADTGTEDALPLLAFTLRELWERYTHNGHLSLDEYRRELGGLQGSLARAAETVLGARRLRRGEEEALRRAFLALVRVNEDGKYVRRQALWSELPSESHDLLRRFLEKRLLVSRERNGESMLEVAHEALFRAWDKLRIWLDEDAASLRVQEGIRGAAAEWDGAGRDDGLLLHRGSRLEAAELLRTDERFSLSAIERAYLDACTQLRDGDRAQRDLYASLILLSQQYIQNAQYELALSWLWQCPESLRNWEWGYLVRLAYLELPAIVLGSFSWDTPVTPVEAPTSFDVFDWHWSTGASPSNVRVRPSFGDLAFSRDGKWFVLREEHPKDSRIARIFDAATGQEVRALPPHTDEVRNASFSYDGERLATAAGKDAYVWDRQSGRLLATLRGHSNDVWAVVFSPDGKRLLTANDDDSARIWDAASGRELVTLRRASTQTILWEKTDSLPLVSLKEVDCW